MSFPHVFSPVICWVCSLIFGVVALSGFKSRDPMGFWIGRAVKPDEIADIPAYNRANGLMWTIYAVCIAMTGIISIFNIIAGIILFGLICAPGLFVVYFIYRHIYKKYKRLNS